MTLRTLLAAALLFAAAPLAAQSPLAPGARVRVSAPVFENGMEVARSRNLLVGTVLRLDSSQITMQTRTGDELSIPLTSIRRIEVFEGTLSRSAGVERGALQGALVGGGAVATILGAIALGDVIRGCDLGPCDSPGLGAGEPARLVAIGSGVGAGIGMLFGARDRSRWTEVDLGRMHISMASSAGATALALSLRL